MITYACIANRYNFTVMQILNVFASNKKLLKYFHTLGSERKSRIKYISKYAINIYIHINCTTLTPRHSIR